jgi:hypothetical protein
MCKQLAEIINILIGLDKQMYHSGEIRDPGAHTDLGTTTTTQMCGFLKS